MVRARVLSIERIDEPLFVVALLEINGVHLSARVDCDFEGDRPLLSEGDLIEVELSYDGFPRFLVRSETSAPGLYGGGEHTVLVGRVTELVGERDFVMDCVAFRLYVDILRGDRPEWVQLGTLVQIHVGTTVVAEIQSHEDADRD